MSSRKSRARRSDIFLRARRAKVRGILIKRDKVADLTTGLRNKEFACIGPNFSTLTLALSYLPLLARAERKDEAKDQAHPAMRAVGG